MSLQGHIQTEMTAEQNWFYLLTIIASIAFLVVGAFVLRKKLQSHSSSNTKEGFELFTLFMLIATLIIFLPVYYYSYSSENSINRIVQSFFLSLYSAMRVLILNEDYGIIRNSLPGMRDCLQKFFSIYAAILYAVTPAIFTFTIFLSFFRNIYTKLIRFLFHWKANLYVFSCLNEESATMAESILWPDGTESETLKTGTKQAKKESIIIVFCNIPHDNEKREALTDLLPYKRKRGARILFSKKSVDKIKVSSFKNEITFFLMDKSETKNIQDATTLSKNLKTQLAAKKINKSVPLILVYASSPASGPLVDALCSNVSVPEDTVNQLVETINEACKSYKSDDSNQADILAAIQDAANKLQFSEPFSIIRIDTKYQMAIKIIRKYQETKTFQKTVNDIKDLKDPEPLTVTLVGLGGLGKDVLKNLLWMYQAYKRKLIVNVFDVTGPELGDDPATAHNPLYDRLAYEWPELLETNWEWKKNPDNHPDTEADYDIRFFLGIDCFSNHFSKLFDKECAYSERLLRSNLILCSLGDDDKNLEAAMMLRQMFKGITGKTDQPEIYAIVYDNQRSDGISNLGQIKNYDGTPYELKTVGSMQSQYCFSDVCSMIKDEKEAIRHHISWICTPTEGEKNKWYDKNEDTKKSDLKTMLIKFVQHEYFIQSSLAKTMLDSRRIYGLDDKRWLNQLLNSKTMHNYGNPQCRCRLCKSRITEHMRWNTYMRVNGYRYGEKRDDMARIQPNLLPWNELPPEVRLRD